MNLTRETMNRLRWLRAALIIPPLEEESLDQFSERVVREALAQSADQIGVWVNDILAERQSSTDVKLILLQIRQDLDKLLLGQVAIKLELDEVSSDVKIIKAQLAKDIPPVHFNFSVGPVVKK